MRWRSELVVTAVLSATTVFLAAAGGASAVSAGATVAVPQHLDQATTLGLVGASDAGLVLTQGWDELLTGHRGTTLADRGATPDASTAGVSGTTFGWSEPNPDLPGHWLVHNENLSTGARTSYDSVGKPLAWTPDGWISLADGILRRHLAADGSTTTLLTGLPASTAANGYLTVTVKADSAGAVVEYPVRVKGDLQQRVGLITFGRAGIDVLATTTFTGPTIFLGPAALSPNRVVWVMPQRGGKEYVDSRLRAGGPLTAVLSRPSAFGIADIEATDDQVAVAAAFDVETGDDVMLQVSVLTGDTWRRIDFPGALDDPDFGLYGGMTAVGSEFLVAVGGDVATVAGVYAIGAGGPIRVATVGAQRSAATDVELSAGQLRYSDWPGVLDPDQDTLRLWQRAVQPTTAAPGLTLGEDHEQAVTAGIPDIDGSSLWSYSAGRGATAFWDYTGTAAGVLKLSDRGTVAHSIRFDRPPTDAIRTSGPFVLLGERAVYRADGKRLADLSKSRVIGIDLFGSSVVQSTSKGLVQLFDAALPASVRKPVTLASTGICNNHKHCADQVAIWASTVAWTRLDGTIVIRTGPTAPLRVVDPAGAVAGLRLSEGTLSWRTTSGTVGAWLLDLSTPTSSPVALGALDPISVDDHLVAGIDGRHRATVSALPFGLSTAYPPRLLGVLAAASFSPDGDGTADTWMPEIDVSKPLDQVRLTLSRDGTVVRELTGTAPDGSIRDLVWDGSDAIGEPVPEGDYRWSLAALASDGDGPLISTDGTVGVSGTVTVDRGSRVRPEPGRRR